MPGTQPLPKRVETTIHYLSKGQRCPGLEYISLSYQELECMWNGKDGIGMSTLCQTRGDRSGTLGTGEPGIFQSSPVGLGGSAGAKIQGRDNNLPKHLTDKCPVAPPDVRSEARSLISSKTQSTAALESRTSSQDPLATTSEALVPIGKRKKTLDGYVDYPLTKDQTSIANSLLLSWGDEDCTASDRVVGGQNYFREVLPVGPGKTAKTTGFATWQNFIHHMLPPRVSHVGHAGAVLLTGGQFLHAKHVGRFDRIGDREPFRGGLTLHVLQSLGQIGGGKVASEVVGGI
ncbi:hypothetical protein BU15DRAFT_68569 [Melanogaster broomeanus]|nr:hypothetical protein BU15DRAFT_68569 [Melanogaster broomeanus]